MYPLLTKEKYLCEKLLNPLTGDFCIVQQKWTGQFFTQLQIWPTEFYLQHISTLLVGTTVHGKYLYLYESRELIFSNTLLSTTLTLLLLIIPLLQPSAAWQILLQKFTKPSCSVELGEGSSHIYPHVLGFGKVYLCYQSRRGSKQHHSQIWRWYLIQRWSE